VSEFDSTISLSDLDGYDNAPVARKLVVAGVSDAGADLDHAFQIPMIFEQGAARLGD
jgi:hypothetical protein